MGTAFVIRSNAEEYHAHRTANQALSHLGIPGFSASIQQGRIKHDTSGICSSDDAAYRHAPFDGTHRHWLPMMGPETPFFTNIPEDPRFSEVAEKLYGDDVFFVVSDANRYVGNTGWHPDHNVDPTKDCYGVKFAYYLEPVDAETGALRLIPGSHKNPLHGDLRENLNELGLEICDVPGYVCKSEPGDVVLSICGAGTQVGVVATIAECVLWFTITTQRLL